MRVLFATSSSSEARVKLAQFWSNKLHIAQDAGKTTVERKYPNVTDVVVK